MDPVLGGEPMRVRLQTGSQLRTQTPCLCRDERLKAWRQSVAWTVSAAAAALCSALQPPCCDSQWAGGGRLGCLAWEGTATCRRGAMFWLRSTVTFIPISMSTGTG
eukprot:363403-Chlamydomonas_euryale.AAC.19